MTPYSCRPTTRLATGSFSSSVVKQFPPRVRLGHDDRRRDAQFLAAPPAASGPRTTDLMSLTAARNRSRSTCRSICSTRIRVPTPVRKMITSIWPVISRLAKSIAAWLRSSGTSRIDGLTSGTPPRLAIIRSISSARRLSNAATRKPANETRSAGADMWFVVDRLSRLQMATAPSHTSTPLSSSCYAQFAAQDSGCAHRFAGIFPRNDLRDVRARNKIAHDRCKSIAPQNMVPKKTCLTADGNRAQWRAVDATCGQRRRSDVWCL